MTSTSGGEAIVSGLVAHGVDTVFGLPGAQVYGLFDAFHQAQLKVIGARHEQACGYMALGYARSSGKVGVFSVVPGPGVLNAGAALLTAFGCNEPVLCLTGQVPSNFLGKGRGHLHEMPDQLATLRSFVKWADRIEYPDAAPALVARAFQEMLSGRRGPVSLEMPWDVFTQRAEVGAAKTFDPFPAPQPDPDRVKAAAALISASKTPMIFVGSGAIDARDEILELAEMIDAPVVAFRSGRGIVSNAHELGLTMAAAYKLWPNTDLMIGIGTRMELPASGFRWPFQPTGLKSVRIDIDPSEMRRLTPDAAVVADAKAGTHGWWSRQEDRLQQVKRPPGRDPRSHRRGRAGDSAHPAADGLLEDLARGAAGECDRDRRIVTGRVCLLVRLPGLSTAHFHHLGLSGRPRVGLSDCARRQDRQPGQTGGGDHRRRRIHVRRAGAFDRRPIPHRRGDAGIQQQRLWQCAARPAPAF
jgi:thiamine pyrophosphate-dependent acetolactate synthase large subunit-like protein